MSSSCLERRELFDFLAEMSLTQLVLIGGAKLNLGHSNVGLMTVFRRRLYRVHMLGILVRDDEARRLPRTQYLVDRVVDL